MNVHCEQDGSMPGRNVCTMRCGEGTVWACIWKVYEEELYAGDTWRHVRGGVYDGNVL